eukprot:TRINITY_DN7341_c0_g1_i1.p1 TRINITY_DN7341_c0_g1~~TRINITY_DN7341_c0_g1_i1.p1  ORF type:complete len:112 (-),score=7.19 TRINITY_DN7341_c0_g1_i1:104-439(-)
MGKLFEQYLDDPHIYVCTDCHIHLASHSAIVSKAFQGRTGKAFLFENVVNVAEGTAEERTLITGRHVVCDIYCKNCFKVLGWTYKEAHEPSQKYKEGKFIIEKANMRKETA